MVGHYMANNIVWFRNDLRIRNNPALKAALAEEGEQSALYILDNRHSKFGDFRRRFIPESLDGRAYNLNQYNHRLQVLSGVHKQVQSTYFFFF